MHKHNIVSNNLPSTLLFNLFCDKISCFFTIMHSNTVSCACIKTVVKPFCTPYFINILRPSLIINSLMSLAITLTMLLPVTSSPSMYFSIALWTFVQVLLSLLTDLLLLRLLFYAMQLRLFYQMYPKQLLHLV